MPPHFQSTMVFVDRFVEVMRHLLKLHRLGMGEKLLHLPMERALIAFQREHVVSLLGHDRLHNLCLAAHCINRDDAAFER